MIALQADALAGCDALAGIERYMDALVSLQQQRDAHGGCPIGSLASQLAERDERAGLALDDGLKRCEAEILSGLKTMAARAELRASTDLELLATQTLAALESGLLLSQVRRDPQQLRIAADAALELIRAAITTGAQPG